MRPTEIIDICGSGGGKVAGDTNTPTEAEDTLFSGSVARVIDVLGEGPIKGLISGAESIYLDDTRLKNPNGTYNFRGVHWNQRKGLPDQDPLPDFPATWSEHALGYEITKSVPITFSVTDENVDSVVVKFMVPQFLKIDKESGDVLATEAKLRIHIMGSGGGYRIFKDVKIRGKTDSTYERAVKIPNISKWGAAPWTIKLERLTNDPPDTHTVNKTYVSGYTETINEQFSMPDVAAVGIEINAKQFGQHVPTRGYEILGLCKIKIPANYDPIRRKYEAGVWDGTFKLAWTDNPAWCFYDLLTNERYGAGVPESCVDKWALYTIGKYCDARVPNGYGKMEPRFTFNACFATREEAYHLLQAMCSSFLSMPYWGAGYVTLAQDSPQDPSHLASPANVIGGEFKYSGTALKARHTVALVTWNDPADGYKTAIELVEDQEMIRKYGWNPIDILAVGCTRRSQARRLGKWTLDSERYQTETVVFRAGLEFFDCYPGNVVKVADPHYAGVRFGGRLGGNDGCQNFLLRSQEHENTDAWVRTNIDSVEVNAAADPNGGQTAEIVHFPGPSAESNLRQSVDRSVSVGQRYTYSVWLSGTGSINIRCGRYGGSNEEYSNLHINLTSTPTRYDITHEFLYDQTAIRCQIIKLAADTAVSVTVWGSQLNQGTTPADYIKTTSGPFVSATPTLTFLPLDAPVTLQSGEEYTVSVVLPNKTVEDRAVSTPAGVHHGITLATALPAAPDLNAMFVLSGSNCEARRFRVLSNVETAPNEREIMALYHDVGKWDRVEQGLEFDPPPTSLLPTGPLPEVVGLQGRPYTYPSGRNFLRGVLLSWRHATDPRITFWDIDYLRDDDEWSRVGETSSCSIVHKRIKAGVNTYRIRGRGVGSGPWKTIDVEVPNTDAIIPMVTGLASAEGGTNFTGKELEIIWDNIRGVDWLPEYRFKDYEVQIQTVAGAVVRTTYVDKESYVYPLTLNIKDFGGSASRSFKVGVRARDLLLEVSESQVVITVEKPAPSLSGYSPTLAGAHNGITLDLTSSPLAPEDVSHYNVYCDTSTDPTTLALVIAADQKTGFLRLTPSTPTTYYVKVTPVDVFGEGTASTIQAVVCDPATIIPQIAGRLDTSQLTDTTYLLLGDVLAKSVTLGTGGKCVSSTSYPRIEISKDFIAGYSDASTKQFYLDAITGKAFAGAGEVILDTNGITIKTSTSVQNRNSLKFKASPTDTRGLDIYCLEQSGVPLVGNVGLRADTAASAASVELNLHAAAYTGEVGSVYIAAVGGSRVAQIALIADDNLDETYIEMTGETRAPKIMMSDASSIIRLWSNAATLWIGACEQFNQGPRIMFYGRDSGTPGTIWVEFGGYDSVGQVHFRHRLSDASAIQVCAINRDGNMLLGQGLTSWNTGQNTLSIKSGTAPNAGTDVVRLYAADAGGVAGRCTLFLLTEDGDTIRFYKTNALTAQLTTLTHTAPGTYDYAVAAPVSGGYGFSTADEMSTVLKCVINLQSRVEQLEARLQYIGLLA